MFGQSFCASRLVRAIARLVACSVFSSSSLCRSPSLSLCLFVSLSLRLSSSVFSVFCVSSAVFAFALASEKCRWLTCFKYILPWLEDSRPLGQLQQQHQQQQRLLLTTRWRWQLLPTSSVAPVLLSPFSLSYLRPCAHCYRAAFWVTFLLLAVWSFSFARDDGDHDDDDDDRRPQTNCHLPPPGCGTATASIIIIIIILSNVQQWRDNYSAHFGL